MSEQIPLGPTQPPAPSGTPPASSSPFSRTQFDQFASNLFAQLSLECAKQIATNNSLLTQELDRIHSRLDAAHDRTTLDFNNINVSIAEVVEKTNTRVNDLEFQSKSDFYNSITAVSQLKDQLKANVTALELSQQENFNAVDNVQNELRRSQLDFPRQLPTSVTHSTPAEVTIDCANNLHDPGLFTATHVDANIFDQSLHFLASPTAASSAAAPAKPIEATKNINKLTITQISTVIAEISEGTSTLAALHEHEGNHGPSFQKPTNELTNTSLLDVRAATVIAHNAALHVVDNDIPRPNADADEDVHKFAIPVLVLGTFVKAGLVPPLQLMCAVSTNDFGTPKPPPAPNLHPAEPDFNLRIVHSNLSVKLQRHELARTQFPPNLLTTIFPAATLLPVSGGSGMLLLAVHRSHILQCEDFFKILPPPAPDIAGRLTLSPHRIWLGCATTSFRHYYSMTVTINDMHASVYVRPIRKPPDFWIQCERDLCIFSRFASAIAARPQRCSLSDDANQFSCSIFMPQPSDDERLILAGNEGMVFKPLEQVASGIFADEEAIQFSCSIFMPQPSDDERLILAGNEGMVFKPLETENSQRIQQQQEVYGEDALTFQQAAFSCRAFMRLEYEQRGVFRRLEQEAGQQSPAAGLCMILERASHRIHQLFMIFRSLETCNRQRLQRQQQQQVYVNDALTFQFSGIFMPQLTDALPSHTECSKLAARPLRKPPFQPAQHASVFQHYSKSMWLQATNSVN